MGIQIALFPTVKTLEDFVRELAVGRYIAQPENVLVFGPPALGKTHLESFRATLSSSWSRVLRTRPW